MKAAVVTSFDHPPRYSDIADPVPDGPDEILVDVLAAGLHHVTRGRASGAHYSSGTALPLIPGIDGVGRGPDGTLRYFVQGPGMAGSMAQKTVIDRARSIALPGDCDPVALAAAMNPGMAAWLALRCRVPFQAGQKVLILGATGSSGSMAVQIARHLGAAQVIAAGRDEHKLAALPALGATDTVPLGDPRLGTLARDVDVVLDFVWGDVAMRCMEAVLKQRTDRGLPLAWIHVGSMAGETAALPGMFLRAANVQIVGSGLGSVSDRAILAELPALALEIARGTFQLDVQAVPLAEVEKAWSDPARGGGRIVFTP
ncbi:NADPH:quinone reductase-like Zn-dependent oxidoreductase [Pseudoduganella flava]|uniref:NADPH:quinone reductase-like Zn-dependent oxidoreductase n=1 Tax=Pseudoduganella flava TaxID=871742 RepID=A0A562PWL6_9BURK|nr:zinc-binding alcohol dehydrogenase family protein [Pseudoduganella flava]QGZ39891.1 zinc-binding dehydrogenase [Pseudoduganella flava]TWI48824.1 NADPH:quinone reductase-like Zn-dependent oxidoreductase [Pseudoduganella flava]